MNNNIIVEFDYKNDSKIINEIYREIKTECIYKHILFIDIFIKECFSNIKNKNYKFILDFYNIDIEVECIDKKVIILQSEVYSIKIDMSNANLFYKRYMKKTIYVYLYKILLNKYV